MPTILEAPSVGQRRAGPVFLARTVRGVGAARVRWALRERRAYEVLKVGEKTSTLVVESLWCSTLARCALLRASPFCKS